MTLLPRPPGRDDHRQQQHGVELRRDEGAQRIVPEYAQPHAQEVGQRHHSQRPLQPRLAPRQAQHAHQGQHLQQRREDGEGGERPERPVGRIRPEQHEAGATHAGLIEHVAQHIQRGVDVGTVPQQAAERQGQQQQQAHHAQHQAVGQQFTLLAQRQGCGFPQLGSQIDRAAAGHPQQQFHLLARFHFHREGAHPVRQLATGERHGQACIRTVPAQRLGAGKEGDLFQPRGRHPQFAADGVGGAVVQADAQPVGGGGVAGLKIMPLGGDEVAGGQHVGQAGGGAFIHMQPEVGREVDDRLMGLQRQHPLSAGGRDGEQQQGDEQQPGPQRCLQGGHPPSHRAPATPPASRLRRRLRSHWTLPSRAALR